MSNSPPEASVIQPSWKPVELSFPLPKAHQTNVHLHITIQTHVILIFLTTTTNGDTSTPASLGSFIYALPDVFFSYHFYSLLIANSHLRMNREPILQAVLFQPPSTFENQHANLQSD